MSSTTPPNQPSRSADSPEPPIGALFSTASEHISTLIRGEVELAKAEIASSAKRGGIGAGMFGAAGVMALYSVTFLFVAIAEGITALGLPRWLSYLIVWAFFILLTLLLVLIGRRLIKKVKAPERTIETLKESKELLNRQPPGRRIVASPTPDAAGPAAPAVVPSAAVRPASSFPGGPPASAAPAASAPA